MLLHADQTARRTFAIISHPDAGKTTLTEKLLLFGGAIQLAGTVKGRKAARHATSDWMKLEQERGISVTSSVMQFPYEGRVVNLLDTPGHEDFSEDTYRTLTAVDSALMVIDCAKGVEERTIKLMEVCRMRTTPIVTFVNKLDREGREPMELLDEVESVLRIACAPITWPIGMGRALKGVYHLLEDRIYVYHHGERGRVQQIDRIDGIDSPAADQVLGTQAQAVREEIELVRGASHAWDHAAYLRGELTPVFFGSAINNFGVRELLNAFVEWAPGPQARTAAEREVEPAEASLTGFVFKIQANMDPAHRDRIAFVRVCSGVFERGMMLTHVATGRPFATKYAHAMFGRERTSVERAYPGDIVGLVNAGALHPGDTLTQGESFHYPPMPVFAPEHFATVRTTDPSRSKQFRRGVAQLEAEGVVQVLVSDRRGGQSPVLAAVGPMQFEVALHRLQHEFSAPVVLEMLPYKLARLTDDAGEQWLAQARGVEVLTRVRDGELLALFTDDYRLGSIRREAPEVKLESLVAQVA